MVCAECDFDAEWTFDRDNAERWANEHTLHPDRDVSGIWAFDRWRVIDGVNHGFPYGAAACGAEDPAGEPPDSTLPRCPKCDAMVEDDVFGSWDWKNWQLIEGINHAVRRGRSACGAGQPDILPPDPDLPLCRRCEELAPSER